MNDIGQFLDGSAPEGLGGQIPPRLLELIAPGFDGYPFVGLRPFEVEDGPFFFGRREQTHDCDRCKQQSYRHGAPGVRESVGKTSKHRCV